MARDKFPKLGNCAYFRGHTITNLSMKRLIVLCSLLLLGGELYAQSGQYVETNGAKIYYETYGEGEPLLLLHGFSLSHKAWGAWIEDLAKQHLLIIPDLRGHGNSTNPSGVYTAAVAANDMYDLMDHLNIDRFQAMGQSAGAVILTHMAIRDTTRISAMILVSGTSYLPESTRAAFKSITYDVWREHMEPHHPGGEAQIRNLIGQLHQLADSDEVNFTPDQLSTINSPTLIIHGDRDRFYSVDIPVNSYQAIPNSYLWVVPNAGHTPAGIYDRGSVWSDVFVKVMDDFFAGEWK